jgi:hypothetical protein
MATKDSRASTSDQTQASQQVAAGGNPAESGDPAVQKLLADHATAKANYDAATGPSDPEAADKWKAEVERIDKELKSLGYDR